MLFVMVDISFWNWENNQYGDQDVADIHGCVFFFCFCHQSWYNITKFHRTVPQWLDPSASPICYLMLLVFYHLFRHSFLWKQYTYYFIQLNRYQRSCQLNGWVKSSKIAVGQRTLEASRRCRRWFWWTLKASSMERPRSVLWDPLASKCSLAKKPVVW